MISCFKRWDNPHNPKINCYSLSDLKHDAEGAVGDFISLPLTITDAVTGGAASDLLQEGWDGITGKTAAEKAGKAIAEAGDINTAAGEKARLDIIENFGPAWGTVLLSGARASNELASGIKDASSVLAVTGVKSSQLLGEGEQSAISSILGIPVGQPTQPYQQEAQARPGSPQAAQEAQIRSQTGEPQTSGPNIQQQFDAQGNPVDPNLDPLSDEFRQLPRDVQQNLALNREQAQANIQQPGGIAAQTQRAAPQAPQIGLSGAEAALQGGAAQSIGAVRQGFGAANQNVRAGAAQGRSDITGARGLGVNAITSGRTDALNQINTGVQNNINALTTGRDSALSNINTGVQGAVGELDVFSDTGENAARLQADFSGANGPAAQAAAYANFNESAGQQFNRGRQEQSLIRNAAALGGLGGGNVRGALQEQASGIAAQQFQQNFQNLGGIANRGLDASTNQGGFRQQGGIAGGNIISQASQGIGNANLQGGLAGANTISNAQQLISGIEQQAGMSLADLAFKTGISTADLASRLGISEADILNQTSTNIGNLRSQAGRDISNINQSTAAGQASNVSNIGTNIANITNQGAINQANLNQATGQGIANIQTGQGVNLANAGLGVGTNNANLAVQAGQAQAAGSLGPANFITQLLGGAIGAGFNPLSAFGGGGAATQATGGNLGFNNQFAALT